ncbi:MAG: cadmium-translocating P-type ATPase [Hoeflea sp.]|uniref:cation-translocating P-type ATPase n=1 Tax=Hoeflea sp. TaxID=1940281 RepID=UPI001D1D8BD1|nr:cation-translocating P-type ATPase [Hoeflea sp.]MBU4528428.1 cadmium-translocating P-type ATPase [Alphaproteobacteria bacterium]MBU4543097.1 cadmium-translocating P-type ATPase [Alphaproteobacteria bacterium]MBU4551788.1 cadmium-translocating P-type ATPase [Alphaproteobacteria bacterium]MBV1723683.1 cadmium-translocating P-type ATPase [Hoeflea sp.]MBV1761999.1 cadmium-translocating P-type ATPase [Hoeflea sp.]
MSCCAAGTESAAELEALKSEGPSAEEMWLSSRPLGDGLRQVDLIVPGVHCGACIALLEKELPRTQGVDHARVNLSTRRVSVVFREADGLGNAGGQESKRPEAVLTALGEKFKALGYPAHLPGGADEAADPALRELLKALAVAGFASMNVMLLSVSVWSGAEAATRDLFHWISALIAAPALIYSGRVFFVSAWSALRHGHANMDVPISLGVGLAYAISLHETITHGEHAYFDASVTLLFFLLAGRTLDHMMREKARSAVRNLVRLSPRGAMVIREDGAREYLALDEIEPGMRLAIAPGDRIPVDGRIVSGRSDMDFAVVNGESAPQLVEAGSLTPAGTLNLTGALVLEATRSARNSFLAEMVSMMEAAESGRAGYRRIADRASSIYAPAVHILALGTFIGWMMVSGDWRMAMLTAVAVLIITCPCALGLAVPVVQVIAAGRLFENGIMVKDGSAMERLAQTDHVVFDKTGTLTRGKPRLINSAAVAPDHLAIAARIARASRHPLSQALADFDTGDAGPEFDITETPGDGVEAISPEGDIYRLGRAAFALDNRDEGIERCADASQVILSKNGSFLDIFLFSDQLRRGAAQAVARLSGLGIDAEILSGDREGPVRALAGELGVSTYVAGVRPRGKVDRVKVLASEGHKPLMVGDGLNDAPALSAAHVSMAPASAADVGRMAADFVFLHDSLEAVPMAIEVSRKASSLIRQNFALAIGYNVIAVPIAVMGYATPLIAALAMSSSSVIVVLNSLRLRRKTRVEQFAAPERVPQPAPNPGLGAQA